MKAAGVTLAAGLLLVLFVAYLFWFPVKTPLVVAAITQYEAPIPPNAWAREDINRFEAAWPSGGRGPLGFFGALASLFWSDSSNVRVFETANQWTQEEEALRAVEDLLADKLTRPGGPDKDVVLLYLSAHGIVDDRGQPCLVLASPPKVDPSGAGLELSPGRWLPIDKLLARIKKISESRRRTWFWTTAPRTKIVLVLDTNRFQSCWELGILYNNFAARLKTTLADAEMQDFAILTASDHGQAAWAGPELRGSLFGRYFVQGMQGAADRAGDHDGRITLDELSEYLNAEVLRWSFENLYEIQKPLLLTADGTSAKSFRLAWAQHAPVDTSAETSGETEKKAGETKTPPAASAATWATLEELWKTHDQLNPWHDESARSSTRTRLVAWQAWQAALVRCEQLARAGSEYEREASELARRLRLVADELHRPVWNPDIAIANLPLLAASQESPLSDERAELVEQLFFSEPKAGEPTLNDFQYAARAIAAGRWATRALDLQRLDKVLDAVAPPAGTAVEPVEIRFLRLFSWLPPGVKSAPQFLQLGVASRMLAERSASPEPRAHYATRSIVSEADASRRQAEDLLYIGRPEGLTRTEHAWSGADEKYRGALKLSGEVAHSFFVRDRAWAELPYLAEWLATRPPLSSAGGAPNLSDRLDRLAAAIGRAHRLGVELDAYLEASLAGDPPPERIEGVRRTTVALEEDRASLERLFEDSVESLKDLRAGDVKSLRQLRSLLAVPLVTGNRRAVLWSKYRQIAGHAGVSTSGKVPDAATLEKSRHRSAEPFYNRQHPALALVDRSYLDRRVETLDAPSKSPAAVVEEPPTPERMEQIAIDQLASQGIRLRESLRLLRGELTSWLAEPASDAENVRPPIAVARSHLSWADRRARAALALVALPLDESRSLLWSALEKVREFDLHHAQVWQAGRALDDFWGSGEVDGGEPYFVLAAGSYLRSAEKLYPYQSAPLSQASKRLDDEAHAARRLVTLSSQLLVPEDDKIGFRSRLVLQFDKGVPGGSAALFAISPDDQPREVKAADEDTFHARLDVPANGTEVRRVCSFQGSSDSTSSSPWRLVGYYRGHVRQWPVDVPPPDKAREVVFEQPKYGAPQVMVRGYSGDPGCVTFVLDCSNSMKTRVGETSRMEEARSALMEILRQLALTHQYPVSLWLYGHRVGVAEGTRRPVWNQAYPRVEGVLPSDDVQRVWATGDRVLDENTLGAVSNLLGDTRLVNYFGKTPLYLAICRAVEDDLALQPRNAPRRLFVITDGQDEPYFPGDNFQPNPQNTRTLDQVVSTIERDAMGNKAEQIQLYLVGWNLLQKPDLRLLAQRVGGHFYNLEAPTGEVQREGLLEMLRRYLGLFEYDVFQATGQHVGRKMLNEYLVLEDHPAAHGRSGWREYFLKLSNDAQKYRFAAEGGESLVWTLARYGATAMLEHTRYDFGGQLQRSAKATRVPNPNREPVDPDFNPAFFFVAAGTPDIRSTDVVFPIAVENDDPTRFSPRPSEFWIEITPLVSRENDDPQRLPAYVFHDVKCEPKYAVPLVRCTAKNWPQAADAAEIDIWFKLRGRETAPLVRRRLGDVRGLDDKPNPDLDVKLGDGKVVQFALDVRRGGSESAGCQVWLESPGGEDAPLYATKVELEPEADEVRHYYFQKAKIVRHAFVYRNTVEDEVQDYRISISTEQDRKRGAVHLRQPVTVRLLRHSP